MKKFLETRKFSIQLDIGMILITLQKNKSTVKFKKNSVRFMNDF